MRRRVDIPKLALVIPALLVLVASSFVSPRAASASGTTHLPDPSGPHSEARSYPAQAPSTRVPATASVSASVTCDGGFNVVPSPNGTGKNYLVSTSVVAANDVWAVGNSTSVGGFDQTLAEHWDGTSWSIVSTPNPGAFDNVLNAVTAISTNDVWAVGAYTTDAFGNTAIAFTEHWNGTSWSVVSAISPSAFSVLLAVTAVSATDVWAVGQFIDASPKNQTLVEHWNGTVWSLVASPNAGTSNNQLFAVSAFTPTDIWAVGYYRPFPGAARQSLAEHSSDGISWSVINSASYQGNTEIEAVSAVAPGQAIAVGYGRIVSSSPAQALTFGLGIVGQGSIITTGNLGSGNNVLLGMAINAGNLVAVGYWRATSTSAPQTLVEFGSYSSVTGFMAFQTGPSSSPSATSNVLYGVSAVSPTSFWATGYTRNAAGVDQTLTELNCDLHFNLGAPATATATSAFALTVTAAKANGLTATGYRGTVHFTSSDSQAVLPADYTFTSVDQGSHQFAGVVLNTPRNQTITVADTVAPYVTGTATITVLCLGACQAPGGTPGARDANPGPSGTAGSRDANQSAAANPGPRLARLRALAANGDVPSGLALATAMGPAPTAGGAASAAASTPLVAAPSVAAAPAEAEIPARQAPVTVLSPTARGEDMMAASRTPATKVENTPAYLPFVLVPLAIISLALLVVRRRKTRRLIGHTRP